MDDAAGDGDPGLKDGAVLRLSETGTVVQWNGDEREAYDSGETLSEFGIHNLHEEDLPLVGVARDAWAAAVAEHERTPWPAGALRAERATEAREI